MIRVMVILLALIATTAGAPFDPFSVANIDEHPGARIPLTLPLTDSNSDLHSLAAIAAGRPLLLVPVLHDCPNLCGVTLDGLAAAMRQAHIQSGRDAAVVAFGIDPKETPEDARRALGRLVERYPELAGRIHATVADQATIRAVTDALGYHYAWDARIGQYAHAAAVAVVTPDGHFSRWLYGLAPEPADLTTALAEARAGKTGGWTKRLLLLCYHYDAATGRYTLAIDWLLRSFGLLTVAALLLYITFTGRRNKACQA
jgi:protein SCO1/2